MNEYHVTHKKFFMCKDPFAEKHDFRLAYTTFGIALDLTSFSVLFLSRVPHKGPHVLILLSSYQKLIQCVLSQV